VKSRETEASRALSEIRKLSRRSFLRSTVAGFAASFPVPLGSNRARHADLFHSAFSPRLSASPIGLPVSNPQSPLFNASPWTPMGQALSRFYQRDHRFECERRMDVLSASIEKLRTALLAEALRVEELLSPRFRGFSPVPEHESPLRGDSIFDVRKAEWGTPNIEIAPLGPTEFSSSLRRFLAEHHPLTLVQLDCLQISAAPQELLSSGTSHNLRTRIRFELASVPPAESVSQTEANPRPALTRWQAVGEWEIEWEAAGTGVSGQGLGTGERQRTPNLESRTSASDWQIVAWRPLEMTTVRGPGVVFTDLTAAAFGEDPSYKSHLLRDANYWRAVLDEASGLDIFGNCGVSVGDADGDGQDEIYLCQPQGLPNRLYRQREPGVFEDVASRAGVDLLDATSMALFADVLNRGRQDLILVTQSRPLLFLNDGHGRFTLLHDAFPPNPQQASLTGAALADYDNDGFLDLYVCSYGYFQGQGATPLPTPYYDAQNGPPNYLYRNRGDGIFEDVTRKSGLDHGNNRYSFACVWADFEDDGWMDLVVVNDFGRDNYYRNRNDGTFEEIENGVSGHGTGMSASVADFDGDRKVDLYVANMTIPANDRMSHDPEFLKRFSDVGESVVEELAGGNAFYRNAASRERGSRAEVGENLAQRGPLERLPGAAGAARGRWNFGVDTFDLENDGRPDIYTVNGFLSSPTPERTPLDSYLWEEIVAASPHTSTPTSAYRTAWSASFVLAHSGHPWNGNERNVFFLNTGKGEFVDASAIAGLDFTDDGRSFAVFDYDGDGDADLVLHNRTGPQLRLLRNDLPRSGNGLAIRLSGKKGNRDAIGARVEIETPAGRQVRYLNCGSGFSAQHSKELIFGLGNFAEGAKVTVRWPGGSVSECAGLARGFRYYLVEGQQIPRRERLTTPSAGGTKDRTAKMDGLPLVEPIPDRFSCRLVDPVPMPSLGAMRMFDEMPENEASSQRQRAEAQSSHRYALLWLWDPTQPEAGESRKERQHPGGLDALLRVQGQLPSRLVLWREGPIPPGAAKLLEFPPWRANERFRTFCSTILAYLFDHRREPPIPTGLVFEVGAGGAPEPAGLASFRKLVKVYWGGADAEEILQDARTGVKSGAAALPFPGRNELCSFRRDFRPLAAALSAIGFPGAAGLYLAQIVENSPNDAEAQYNLALSRRETGKTEAALTGVRAALASRPVFPEAENLLAVLLMDSGKLAEAQAQLEKTTRETPDFAEAWNNLGYVFLERNELDAAHQAFERAVSLAPNFPSALNNLGIVSARQGEQGKAEELFHRALAIEPGGEQAANNLGVLYARQGKTQLAVETFQALLQHNPDAASVLYNLARLNLSLGKASEARALLESWLTRHASDPAALRLLEQAKAKQ